MTHGEFADAQAIIDFYGPGANVAFPNGMQTSLGEALSAEDALCPADEVARQDPLRRMARVAGMLAAGNSLRPEHEYLLSLKPEE